MNYSYMMNPCNVQIHVSNSKLFTGTPKHILIQHGYDARVIELFVTLAVLHLCVPVNPPTLSTSSPQSQFCPTD